MHCDRKQLHSFVSGGKAHRVGGGNDMHDFIDNTYTVFLRSRSPSQTPLAAFMNLRYVYVCILIDYVHLCDFYDLVKTIYCLSIYRK